MVCIFLYTELHRYLVPEPLVALSFLGHLQHIADKRQFHLLPLI